MNMSEDFEDANFFGRSFRDFSISFVYDVSHRHTCLVRSTLYV